MTKFEILTTILSSLALLISLANAIYHIVTNTKSYKMKQIKIDCQLSLYSVEKSTYLFLAKISNKANTSASISKILIDETESFFFNKETHSESIYLSSYEMKEVFISVPVFDQTKPFIIEVFTPTKSFMFSYSSVNELP